ncbi:SEC-C motif-containing protein [Psychrobacillus psychrotolerans]|uniref:SEC-C motif-containing protein n=1 Tax=Psychrobacillus psychrotolerans TaxID=126156 RepID=A0A1I6AT76_9BACI|nr:plasmid pRiA4b ORF-3 family protein [Psychrobacillus psychrotolerans]SFQ71921.1 SEC-C motif-containing protein [Psychrobacillus psychrotolerans]
MKAYQLNLIFENIEPLIWRKVILPAGATFNRLHETIQYVTNFQSEMEPYHYFAVEIEDLFITNNADILEEYKGKRFLNKLVKQSNRIKIDDYLEKNKQFIYNYDFGDDWRIRVVLEEIVEDYYFGYPTLLDGQGMAPPEDVGGPPGYEEFLKIYSDPSNAEYLSMHSWAESQKFLPLDIASVNDSLKYVKYQKTEWEYVHHKNYSIISDKYRGSDIVDIDVIPNKDLIVQYAIACGNLYGIIEFPKFLEIYNAQNKTSLTLKELLAILKDSTYSKLINNGFVYTNNKEFIHEALEYELNPDNFRSEVKGKPYFIPEKKELLRYVDDLYYEKTIHQRKLATMLKKDFIPNNTKVIKDEMDELVGELQNEVNFTEVVKAFLARFEFRDIKQVNEYMQVVMKIANTTRLWENRGHTPDELSQIESPNLQPPPPLTVIDGGKVGRNDPCSCGSGKKYKKCCGK